MKIWLDDIRTPPDDSWKWCKSITEVKLWFVWKDHMHNEEIEEISLDNDLGENEDEGRKLVLWMAEFDFWPSKAIYVHSANTIAHEYMVGVINRYSPFTIK